MPSNRLEFRYSTPSRVVMRFTVPILLGLAGLWSLREGVAALQSSDIGLIALLPFGLLSLAFIYSLLKASTGFTNKPQIVIDEKGITDNQRQNPLIIPWDDIREISFPYRVSDPDSSEPVTEPQEKSRLASQAGPSFFAVSIKFRDPQKYHSQIPPRHIWHTLAILDPGDYEIDLHDFDGTAYDVYDYLQKLRKEGRIPSTLEISKVGSDLDL